jgi:hypothetical protein
MVKVRYFLKSHPKKLIYNIKFKNYIKDGFREFTILDVEYIFDN